ncbi:MAG TPA: amino acid adenylation domain-containing protein, partial [Blastocatellia bacterium]|nr:amino acid adenylation domain-containing protein [Blastocatellia bacterium]
IDETALNLTHEECEEYPLSHGQQALWFLHRLAPESAAYNLAAALRIDATLDVQALRRAFQRLVDRHASLRTSFADVAGKPVQKISPRAEVCFQQVDSCGWGDSYLNAQLTDEARRPFDLRGPLMRVIVYARGVKENILFLVIHHIIADLWSLGVLMHELGILYGAEKAGDSVSLPPLSLQYTDYVRWQAGVLAGPEGNRLRSYWQKQLAGELPGLNLPTDKPRPRVQTYNGASHPFKVAADLTQQIKGAACGLETSLFVILLAAFEVLLHRYTGQEDFAVGTPTAGRAGAEFSGIVGYFVNPVALRANGAGHAPFKEFLSRVRQTALDAFDHENYPFALMVDQLQARRDPSRSPLFQVMFALQKTHLLNEQGLAALALGESGARVKLGDLTLECFPLEQKVAQLDLALTMVESDGALSGSIQFNTDLYDRTTIERLAGHFTVLLGGISADPSCLIHRLPMLSQPELRQLLSDWNDTSAEFPGDKCIHELFERQQRLTPDSIAATFLDDELSYSELNSRANQLAHHLIGMGAGRDKVVAVCVDRSEQVLVGLLAILKSGACYLPVDPSLPAERAAFIMQDSHAHLLLTESAQLVRLPALTCKVVCLDSDASLICGQSRQNPTAEATPDDLAYILYTSGSTGMPKGVEVCHRPVVNLLDAMTRQAGINQEDVLVAVTTISFDIAALELFAPLIMGGRVVIASHAEVTDPERLAGLIERRSATVMQATPATWRMLIGSGWEGRDGLKMLSGGESLSRQLADDLASRGAILWNAYGPTETTIWSTLGEVTGGQEIVTIGRPISNTQVYVLDAWMQAAPIGVIGELYVAGEGLARGYKDRAELTAERFLPNPFAARAGARMYRTGDLCRYRSGGSIELIGRTDGQVKVRGYRIEPGEVEAVLNRLDGVTSSVVVAREFEGGDKRLVAYVEQNEGSRIDARELKTKLSEKLPEYMVPSTYVLLDKLPLTPNGKIDRRALPLPDRGGMNVGGFKPPQTGTEEILAGIFSELIGIEQVGVSDDFFELGGHSLLAVQVISRIRDVFHLELPLRTIFEFRNVAELGRILDRGDGLKDHLYGAEIIPKRRSDSDAVEGGPGYDLFPLSFAQSRMWFLTQMEPDSPLYNMAGAITFKGQLHIPVLQKCLREIVKRHEILRTNFFCFDTEPVQLVRRGVNLTLPVTDLSDLPDPQAEAFRLAKDRAGAPFSLAQDLLIRCDLLRLGGEEYMLVAALHHIVCDGWSIGVFARELAALYEAFLYGKDPPLAPLAVQYGDFSLWQRQHFSEERLEADLAYWADRLGDSPPPLELPSTSPRPAVQTYLGARQYVSVPDACLESLRRLSREEGVTIFIILVAALDALLHRYTGSVDINIGSPVASRSHTEIEPLIGLFANTLVLRTDLSGDPTFLELTLRARDVIFEAFSRQHVPFEKLVEALRADRSLSHTPLFQTMFAFQRSPVGALELPGLAAELIELDIETAKFDLTLNLAETSRGIDGWFEYKTDVLDKATAGRMCAHFENLLRAIATDPARQISCLPMLSEEERRQALIEWNDTFTNYPRSMCVHQLVEEAAGRAPHSIALVSGDQLLTYAELNGRANSLAHRLRRMGVGPEVLVAVFMRRSIDLVVALLGVLKAGGAYFTLEPANPKWRTAHMLEGINVPVVITREQHPADLPDRDWDRICIDSDWDDIAREPHDDPINETDADNLAYVVFTSGSTGKPKGVQIRHGSLVNLIFWHRRTYAVGPSDRVSHLAGLGFDASVWELWPNLVAGASVYLIDDETRLSPSGLRDWLTANGLAISFLPTPLAESVLSLDWDENVNLRLLLTGGDRLTRYAPSSLGFDLINHYGPSECTVVTTAAPTGPGPESGLVPPIGRPIDNTRVYCLDEQLHPVPAGVPGELHIAGEALARGYVNQPDATAAKFIPDPFGSEPGSRLYKTGDLAAYLADGNISFLGRKDQQVKIRGIRVELGEIEFVLRQHPDVKQAVVLSLRDATGGERLAAYVVADGQSPLNEAELRRFLKERLPEFIVITSFIFLDEMPLTANGKLDRSSLPAPQEPSIGEPDGGRPMTPFEEILARIWSDLLQCERVEPQSNFFDLGGHSLVATQVMSRIRDAFKVELPLRTLFDAATLRELAASVEASLGAGEGVRLKPIRPGVRRGQMALSYAQQRLWFLDQLEPG